MITVFIAGSRSITHLNTKVKQKIDNIISKNMAVIIGDANGVDKTVQEYLKSKNYRNVVIFRMEDGCRNNLGEWPSRAIQVANSNRRDFAYYSTKDRAMADEADYGLMLWDGQSRGTLTNVINLLQKRVPVVLHIGDTFYTINRFDQLNKLLQHMNVNGKNQFEQICK